MEAPVFKEYRYSSGLRHSFDYENWDEKCLSSWERVCQYFAWLELLLERDVSMTETGTIDIWYHT